MATHLSLQFLARKDKKGSGLPNKRTFEDPMFKSISMMSS